MRRWVIGAVLGSVGVAGIGWGIAQASSGGIDAGTSASARRSAAAVLPGGKVGAVQRVDTGYGVEVDKPDGSALEVFENRHFAVTGQQPIERKYEDGEG